MERKVALVMLISGIALLVSGFFVTFLWTVDAPLETGPHLVKANSTLELSWYLQEGDRTEGMFNISGGNEQASLTIKNPFGQSIYCWHVNRRYDGGFTAQDTGMYTMAFWNLDAVSDQTIGVYFLSPYEPRVTVYDVEGIMMMLGSVVVLFLGIRAFGRS